VLVVVASASGSSLLVDHHCEAVLNNMNGTLSSQKKRI